MIAQGLNTTAPLTADTQSGRGTPVSASTRHRVTLNPMFGPFPAGLEHALFGMGCFWGAERLFWQQPGVYTTAVGFAGGRTPNPSYYDVCTGRTGHSEVVQIVFDPNVISYVNLLRLFWESHDPTQGVQQDLGGGDQYRSGIYTHSDDQRVLASASRSRYQCTLSTHGFAPITTEILPAPSFYYAEDFHQQYLHKNPEALCTVQGTGISYIDSPTKQAAVVTREVFV